MFAALRGRGASAEGSTRRRFAETEDSGAMLDIDEQENVVASLEHQARNAARVWRFAFGVTASLFSLFFARLATIATTHDRAETRDVAWSQPVHIHAYHENASLQTTRTLDAATAVAPARGAWYTRPFSIQKVFFGEFSFPFSFTRPTDGDPEPAELHMEPPYVPAPKRPFAERRLLFFSFSYVSPASAATPASSFSSSNESSYSSSYARSKMRRFASDAS